MFEVYFTSPSCTFLFSVLDFFVKKLQKMGSRNGKY